MELGDLLKILGGAGGATTAILIIWAIVKRLEAKSDREDQELRTAVVQAETKTMANIEADLRTISTNLSTLQRDMAVQNERIVTLVANLAALDKRVDNQSENHKNAVFLLQQATPPLSQRLSVVEQRLMVAK